MLLNSLPPSASYRFRARNCARPARPIPRLPCGVLTNKFGGSSESFVKLHQEVQQDSEWYGPEAADHTVSPAAVAAAPATAATRDDVRLMASFTKFLRSNKLDLSALFCNEAVLSADSRLVCDPQAGHHTELLSEFLTSGRLRIGEELPHWFVNGNLRGAIKCWMATRPAAAALSEVAAAASGGGAAVVLDESHPLAQRRRELAASVAEAGVVGAPASVLVDHLIAAMPGWSPALVAGLAGWEPAEGVQATAEDVAALHCFGALVYGSRLDVAVFLQQLCGADPFTWTMAQVAQGVISEPEPWLLERFFMSRHSVGEALPLWFAKWGVREEIGRWLRDQKAAQLVQKLLEARGVASAPTTLAAASEDSAAASGNGGGGASTTASDPRVDAARSTALAHLEASAGGLLCSAMTRRGVVLSPSLVQATISCRRDVELYDSHDGAASTTAHSVDLLATCTVLNSALVASVVQVPCGDGAAAAAATAIRQAKEQLDWLDFLLRRRAEAGGLLKPQTEVAKALVLLSDGEGTAESVPPPSVAAYLEHSGVLCVRAAELPYTDA